MLLNRQTSAESASLPQYDEGTESAEVATSDVLLTFLQILLNLKRTFFTLKKNLLRPFIVLS